MENQLNCLRCGAKMRFLGREKLQRSPDLIISDLTFALVGGREINIYSCPKCGKLEFSSPKLQPMNCRRSSVPTAARSSTLTTAAALTASMNSDSIL